MAQVPGLGLDQSQLADVINQQYKGYSQKQRNQMMQSAATTPDNWGAITQQANKTATQPTEFLGAGRLNNIPTVSKDGQQWQRVDSDTHQNISPWMPSNHTAPYQNDYGTYYDSNTYSQYQNATNMRDWVNTYVNPNRYATVSVPEKQPETLEELVALQQQLSAPTQKLAPIESLDQFVKEYGQTPEGGWSDRNTKYAGSNTSLGGLPNKNNPMQMWLDNPNASMNFSLYGSGSPEDIQRGFNVLQRSAPQNIGEFWSMSPEVQKGILQNPGISLQQMQATANPANGDWLSIGAEGGLRDISAWQWNNQTGLTPQAGSYIPVDDSNSGLLGSLNEVIQKVDPLNGAIENTVGKALGFDSGLDMVRGVGEPVGNLAGAIFSGGVPWGSIVMATDNISTGNDEALLGNVINGVGSYAGSSVGSGGVMGTDVSLGSAAANSAANNMIINAGANYARTGDLENALKAAAFSTASGAAGNWLGSATASSLGEIGSKALGGAASEGLNSLFTKNSPIEGSLFGAMSGGLHGFLNSTDRSNNTYNRQKDTKNRQTAQAATRLAKLFTKK